MVKIKLIRDVSSSTVLKPCVATIGNFDGLHRGHYSLIQAVVEKANVLQYVPTVITFEPLPVFFFKPHTPFFRLTSVRQKIELLAKWGIRQVICLRFNKSLMQILPQTFIESYLQYPLNVRHLIVGNDFRFGYQGKGSVETLQRAAKQLDFGVEIMPLRHETQQRISSTLIRQALVAGELAQANLLLGRNYNIYQRVIKGNQRGATLGFPTANLAVDKQRFLLKGVFITKVYVDGKMYYGAANSGVRPTVDGRHHLVEVHIIDFSQNIYGKRIRVEFLHKIRDELHFKNIEDLKRQIDLDVKMTKDFFRETALTIEQT